MNTPFFYIFLFFHLVFLVIGFGSVMVIDTFGLLWLMRFKKITLEFVLKVADVTQLLIWLGWGGLVASGIPLLLFKNSVDNLTKIKLFLVVLLGFNGVALHVMKKSLGQLSIGKDVPLVYKFRIGIMSFISQFGWWGALVIGFVHRHIEHTFVWPQNSTTVMLGIVLFFLGVIGAGETIFRKK